MELTPSPSRITIDRSFWTWVVVGMVAAWSVGALYAHYLQLTAGWKAGVPLEVALLQVMHTRLPVVVDRALLLLPWFGTNITILPGIAIASWRFHRHRRPDLTVALVVAAAGNYVIGFGLKYAFDRPRPALWPGRGEYTGPSYPSGHAMMATSVLFVAAYLLRRERGWRWPYVVAVLFGILTVYSRLYLGVHWPTDVFAGTLIGATWLSAMLRAMRARLGDFVLASRPVVPRELARVEPTPTPAEPG